MSGDIFIHICISERRFVFIRTCKIKVIKKIKEKVVHREEICFFSDIFPYLQVKFINI